MAAATSQTTAFAEPATTAADSATPGSSRAPAATRTPREGRRKDELRVASYARPSAPDAVTAKTLLGDPAVVMTATCRNGARARTGYGRPVDSHTTPLFLCTFR